MHSQEYIEKSGGCIETVVELIKTSSEIDTELVGGNF